MEAGKKKPGKKIGTTIDRKHTAMNTGPRPDHGYWNKWQIPFRSYTQKTEYQRAYALCRKYNKPYPESLELDKKAEEGKAKKSKAPVKAPKKTYVKKERLPYKMKNKPSKVMLEVPTSTTDYPGETPYTATDEDPLDPPMQHDDQPETYQIKDLDQELADALPEERPPTGHKEKREAALTMETIKIGDKVRQLAGFPSFHGTGIVKRAPLGRADVLVGFDNGQSWILKKNLARAVGGEA
jgi:hypothetical protein